MSVPRQVLPGTTWLLTRRCTQRQFLLRPDEVINNAFLYCLIEAAIEFEIVLLLSQMMSNHHHTVFYDPKGNAIEFMHRLHTNFAKVVNAYRGRSEAMWSSDPPSLVELVGLDTIVDKLIYTATNPVKDGLVGTVHEWPGPKTVRAFLNGRILKATRPWHIFREDGEMPAEVMAELSIPEQLGDHDEIVERVRAGIADVEAKFAAARARDGTRVVGRRSVLRRSWDSSPMTVEPRRVIRPRVAARDEASRIAALKRNADFQIRYRIARQRWLEGEPAVFPAGTYWLRRFANVPVESMDPIPIGVLN
jgi:putative transposase